MGEIGEQKEGRGRRGASAATHGHPFTPQPPPLHGELRMNHHHFLDSLSKGLIHGLYCKIEDFLLVVVPSCVE
jgi:hypothetical protein